MDAFLRIPSNQQLPTPNIEPNNESTNTGPPLRSVDSISSTIPANVQLTVDELRRNVGFRNVDTLIKNFNQITNGQTSISSIEEEPTIDLGSVATIHHKRSNTTPLPQGESFGDVFHCDIGFGVRTAIGGNKYCLFLIDRATRMKYIYGLKTLLGSSIQAALRQFVLDIGRFPKRLLCDFDTKLIRGESETFLKSNGVQVQSAPAERQMQNGLAERNWQSIVRQARGWLTSNLLPSEFWFYAIKRAAEVSNYLPIKANNVITTPFELAYDRKPDMRSLFPLFSIGYFRKVRDGDVQRDKYDSHSLRGIAIGKSNDSDGLVFYHPTTKTFHDTSDYKLDPTLASGPAFGLKYNGGIHFKVYNNASDSMKPPTYPPESVVQVTIDNQIHQATVIDTPKDNNLYTLQLSDGSIHQIEESSIQPAPATAEEATEQTIPSWITTSGKATLYLPTMKRPKQGYLRQKPSQEWEFIPGRSKTSNTIAIPLPDFEPQVFSMIEKFQLYEGHKRFDKIREDHDKIKFHQSVARHVSAAGLDNMSPPTLSKHSQMTDNDKTIWDAAYREEYTGLHEQQQAWSYITEAEYKILCKTFDPSILPTMAISTIKYDEHGKPKRAKYRIVALGNLDPHEWSKDECFAPVLSHLELRIFLSMAIKYRRIAKNCDIKQAFCQSVLPPDEKYVLRPPPHCPFTPPKTYLLLKKTLYGLKRSPRHWYMRLKSILNDINLQQCPNAPCLFHGEIIPGKPPIYVGIYVDDLIYFSPSDDVEKEFEKQLAQKVSQVDYMGPVSHFLGIKFQWKQEQNNLSVHLSQEAFTETLLHQFEYDSETINTKPTPYRSGLPVDAIPDITLPTVKRHELETKLRSIVGSLNWLASATRPDIATITNMLAQYQHYPSPGHLESAKYVLRYLKGTKSKGITLSSKINSTLQSFVKYPIINDKITAITDANWGPQDQSLPSKYAKQEIALHKTRSISGYAIYVNGLIHWSSKRQTITAASTTESEIYATNEAVKELLHIKNILEDLNLTEYFLQPTTPIFNDNAGCVDWSKSFTMKSIRHMQIRENLIRENVASKFIHIKHCEGKLNIADLFTKEDKDVSHFCTIRDVLVQDTFT